MENLTNLKLNMKLPLAFAGVALSVGILMGSIGLSSATSTLIETLSDKLTTISQSRATSLESYLHDVKDDLKLMASNPQTSSALQEFNTAFSELGNKSTDLLQTAYISKNKHPLGSKHLLDKANAGSRYDNVHEQYHPTFREILSTKGFYDIFLFNLEGDLVYSVFKEADFATNFGIQGGQWSTSDLGKAFRAASKENFGEIQFFDFSAYAPSNDAPAAFMSTPVANKSGKIIGVAALQMPIGKINSIMNEKTGLGVTGETVIVGADLFVRNDSSFTETDDILSVRNETEATLSALEGNTTTSQWTNGANQTYDIASVPFTFYGANWAILAMQGADEARAGLFGMRNFMLLSGCLLLLVTCAIAVLISRSITVPISRLTDAMKSLAAGMLKTEVPSTARKDEIGNMAAAVLVFKDNAVRIASLSAEEEQLEKQRKEEHRAMMFDLQTAFGNVVGAASEGDFSKRVAADFPDEELNTLANNVNNLVETVDRGLKETGLVLSALSNTDLTKRVNGRYGGAFNELKNDTNMVADRLSEIVGKLQETSGGLKSATSEILAGANDLSDRTTRQASSIEETSAAMEELSNTVDDNATKADEAQQKTLQTSKLASSSGEVMGQASQAMERIGNSSSKISSIIGMIDDIAFQTNLLALNASVEAARAGEAGKGFAVVAIEVRRLAQSAAQASAEVKVLIEQSATEVEDGTKLVADASTKIADMLTAVTENTSLMSDISSANRDQASAIESVTSAVKQMDEMTQHNAALVEETNAAIEQTEEQAVALDGIVEVFKVETSETGASREPKTRLAS